MRKKKPKNHNLLNKKYRYELLENGFTNEDISVGKKVLNYKKFDKTNYLNKIKIE